MYDVFACIDSSCFPDQGEDGAGDDRSNVGVVDVGERMARLAGRRNVLDAEFVDEIVRVIETGEWVGDGYKSVSHWLTIQFGLSPAQARRFEDVARRIGDFPLTAAQFRAGLLLLDQFRAVVLHAPSWADVNTFDLVRYATEPQIRRIIRAEFPHFNPAATTTPSGETDDDTAPTDEAVDDVPATTLASLEDDTNTPFHSYFAARWTPEGRYVGSFDLAAHAGLTIAAALSEARDALFQQTRKGYPNEHGHSDASHDDSHTDGDTRRPDRISWVDAFTEIARRALNSAPSERADRHKVMIHIDTNNLPSPTGQPVTQLDNGAHLPPSIAEYLCCDTTARSVWETDCLPLGVGTATRTIPDRLRRVITYRDQGCRVPGCGATIVEIHHIWHWQDGGPTELWNLISLCSKHHQMHHDGRLTITGDPNDHTLTFGDRQGRPIQFAPRPIPPPTPSAEPTSTESTSSGQPPHQQQSPPPRYTKPPCDRLNLAWFSQWEPPTESPNLNPTEQTNWDRHQQQRRRLQEPPQR